MPRILLGHFRQSKTQDDNSFVSCELSRCVCQQQPVCPRAVWSTVSAAATDPPQLSQSRAAGGGRGGGSGGSVQYLHSIYTISTLSTECLLYLRSLHSHTAAAETMLRRRRAVVGPEPRLRAATRRLSLFLD